jgi:hypothetical protein
MKLLKKCIKKPARFQRVFGISVDLFKVLVKRILPAWEQAESERKEREARKRKIGGGRKFVKSLDEMVAIVLLYYKTYMTQELIGEIVGLDQSNISRIIGRIGALIERAADPELSSYLSQAKADFAEIPVNQRVASWDAFLSKHPDLRMVCTDATEQQSFRPSDKENQKERYSGKKKRHGIKTQISVSKSGRILDISKTYPGRVHDKKVFATEQTGEKFPEKTAQLLDLGFPGAPKDHPNHYIILPNKRPPKQELTPYQKELNRAHSKRRVIVEHIISRIKKFKICSYLYRGDIAKYNQIFRSISALLNFRLRQASLAAQ